MKTNKIILSHLLRCFLLISLALLLSSCANQSPPLGDYFQPDYNQPPAGWSNLYIFNQYAITTNGNPTVYVDWQRVGKLVGGSYTLVKVQPGEHSIAIDKSNFWGATKPQEIMRINLAPNKTYYLQYNCQTATSMTVVPVGSSYAAVPETHIKSESFKLIDRSAAISTISACRWLQPLIDTIN